MIKRINIIAFFLLCFVHISAQEQVGNKTPRALKKSGKLSLQMGDTYSAIDYFEAYCKVKPNDYAIQYDLAECYRAARNYEKALHWYKTAYATNPTKNVLALYHYGCMLKTEQKYEEAATQFKTLRKELKPNKQTQNYRRLAGMQIAACDSAQQLIDSALSVEITHLSTDINKASIEFSPQSINDSTLLYASLRTDTVVYSVTNGDNEHLPMRKFYTAKKQDNEWVFDSEWNNALLNPHNQNIGNGAFSPDGTKFYFTRCEQNWKYQNLCKIYVTHKKKSTWSEPELLPEIINSKDYSHTQPALGTLSKTGDEVLYFVSNRPGGRGGYDIWYSIYMGKKKEWREPKNCGNKVNTSGDELTPYYDDKTKTLYFSSDGLPGLGELDVFSALGETNKFEDAENIGYPINSSYDDLYYVLDKTGQSGFFTSNRPGVVSYMHPTCCDDIFAFSYLESVQIIATGKVYKLENQKIQSILQTDTEQEPTDSSVTYIEGAEVSLFLRDNYSSNKILLQKDSTNESGAYMFTLKTNKDYTLSFTSTQTTPTVIDFSTKHIIKTDTLIFNDVGIEYISQKEPFVIRNIYYDFDEFKLRKSSLLAIDTTLLIILREAPDIIIELSSHTDNKGTDEYNQVLSQKRAESVVQYLIKQGIDKKRLVAKGYGATLPIAPNQNPDGSDNPDGRQKNRRTEFKIIGNLSQYSEILYEE